MRWRNCKMSPLHSAAWDVIRQAWRRVEDARRASIECLPTSADLLSGLRINSSDVYALGGDLGRYVPCVAALMAEPPAGHQAVPLLTALPPDVAARYRRTDRLFRQPDDIPEDFAWLNRSFSTLKGASSEWRKYLQRPEVQQLWE